MNESQKPGIEAANAPGDDLIVIVDGPSREQLEESNRRYRELFDFAPVAYIETDRLCVITEANRAAEDLLGTHRDRLPGRPVAIFVAESDRRLLRNRVFSALEGATVRGLELRIQPRNRPAFFADADISPALDTTGAVGSLRWVIRDLTQRKLDESLLRDSEARMRLVVGQIPAVVWTTDASFRLTSLEGGGLEKLSIRAGEAMGLTLDELVEPHHKTLGAHRSALEGTPVAFELEIAGRHLTAHLQPLRDRTGAVAGCIGVAYDVTERRTAELALAERESRLRLLVEQVPAILWTTNTELRVTGAMGSGLAVLGRRPEEAPGVSLIAALGPDDAASVPVEAHLRALQGESVTYEMDWKGRSYRVSIEPLTGPDGTITGCSGVALDVSDDRRIRVALESALEREMRSSAELQRMNEMKDILMKTLSHDLRSPLTSVLGYAATLARFPHIDTDQARTMIRRIGENAQKLERILQNLLDLDRLDRRILEPQREETDLADLANAAVDSFDFGNRPVTVEAAGSALVDGVKVERILDNLISDCLKHTPEDVPLWVRMTPTADRGVLFIVEDAGPGFPDELKEHAFEPFVRGKDVASAGLGIGLTIVARFAELHGGRAWIEDRPGGGASFHVLLPGPASGEP